MELDPWKRTEGPSVSRVRCRGQGTADDRSFLSLGAVRFAVDAAPDEVNDCNCSICRRYGALWAYYRPSQVRFAVETGPTDIYLWGDRELEFHRCRTCGCVTHWSAVDRTYERMGVNARLMAPEVLSAIPVFHGDGASM